MRNYFKTRYKFFFSSDPVSLLFISVFYFTCKNLPVIIYKYTITYIPPINKGIFFFTLSNTSNIEKQISNLNPPLKCFYHFMIVNHFLFVCVVYKVWWTCYPNRQTFIISYRFDLENRSCDNVS